MKKESYKKNADLLVAGAGISGICCAIAAARKGLSVILINDRSVLGGNASSEIGVQIHGASHHGLNPAIYAKETGIVEEIRLRMGYYQQGGYGHLALTDAVLFDMVYNEKNIKLLMNTIVTGCEVKLGHISKVYARHNVSNELFEITADNFVDATGNGTLAYEAGAEFRVGRESKEEFDEYWAPDHNDSYTMGHSLFFETEDAGHEVPYKAPDFAYDITKLDFLKNIDKAENFREFSCYGPHWTYEYGGQIDNLHHHDDVELELRKLIYGIWDYVKNSGKYPEARNRVLKRVYAKAGSRENRRFIGDYILTENDIENKVDFKDSVAMGGWPMDVHAPLGIYDSAPASNFVPVTGNYNIPFRTLYSKDIDNLMMAGRDISVTHIALGSTRVMATCGAIGQAVGTAAFISKKYHVTPREIYQHHMAELQKELLEDDQSILHRKKELPKYPVAATSVMPYENVKEDDVIPLIRNYALALPLDSAFAESVQIKLQAEKDTVLEYQIFTGNHKETYLPDKLEKECSLCISKGEKEWVTLTIDCPVGQDGKIYIVLKENQDISIAMSETRPIGVVTMRMHTTQSHDGRNHDSIPLNSNSTGYEAYDHQYEKCSNILFKNVLPEQHVYDCENVFNGYSRPYGVPNIWLPENNRNQSIFITLSSENIKGLDIVLDNQLDVDGVIEMPKTLAKKMLIEIENASEKKEFLIEDNYQRVVKIRESISGVTKISITIMENYGQTAGIYEVNVKR